MGSLAEFERALIAERTKAGLDAARRRGVRIGRRKAMDPDQVRHARALLEAGERPTDIARTLQVGRSTLYRALDVQHAGKGQTA
jgi:DNA invertase Pin-like site-specific DNA recombinase